MSIDAPSIEERYSTAVRSSNLKSKPDTTRSDSDVLGAAGLASRKRFDGRPGVPIAMALTRLFSGDNRAAHELVRLLSEMAWGKAFKLGIALKRVQAVDMAKAVLAWHRDGACQKCGGHGFALIKGTKTIGDAACPSCAGSGKLPFDRQFAAAQLEIARWLLAEVQGEQSKAGPAAMAALAPSLDI